MDRYQREQKELAAEVNAFESIESELFDKRSDAEKCVDLLAQYAEIEQLTAESLNALISRIEVHDCQPVDGVMRQKLDIYHRYAGVVNSCEFSSITFNHTKHITSPTKARKQWAAPQATNVIKLRLAESRSSHTKRKTSQEHYEIPVTFFIKIQKDAWQISRL